jgi:Fic family protein
MKMFFEWIERASGIDPGLKAGIARLWFVTIHPFEDGDGRIGRAQEAAHDPNVAGKPF